MCVHCSCGGGECKGCAAQYRERIAELEAHTPTQWAYDAACKALAHWRKEAHRLGKLAKVAPRAMKLNK